MKTVYNFFTFNTNKFRHFPNIIVHYSVIEQSNTQNCCVPQDLIIWDSTWTDFQKKLIRVTSVSQVRWIFGQNHILIGKILPIFCKIIILACFVPF